MRMKFLLEIFDTNALTWFNYLVFDSIDKAIDVATEMFPEFLEEEFNLELEKKARITVK